VTSDQHAVEGAAHPTLSRWRRTPARRRSGPWSRRHTVRRHTRWQWRWTTIPQVWMRTEGPVGAPGTGAWNAGRRHLYPVRCTHARPPNCPALGVVPCGACSQVVPTWYH
jgi:hypothetical protein